MKFVNKYCALGLAISLIGAPLGAYAASGNDAQANGGAGLESSGAGGSPSASGSGNQGTGGAGSRTNAMTCPGANGQVAVKPNCAMTR